jgi:Family of unknown function (DUF5681)
MADDGANSSPKQPTAGSWRPGTSGNPRGRRPGSRNRLSALGESVLAREGTALLEKAVEMAKAGDVACLRLLIERIAPIPKASRFVALDLPPLKTVDDLVKASAVIVAEVAAGRLAMEDVGPLVALIEATVEAIRTNDHDQRLTALERFADDKSRLHVVSR